MRWSCFILVGGLLVCGCLVSGSWNQTREIEYQTEPKTNILSPEDVEFIYQYYFTEWGSLKVLASITNLRDEPLRDVVVHCDVYDEYEHKIGKANIVSARMGDLYKGEVKTKEILLTCENLDHVNEVFCWSSLKKRRR